MATCRPTSVFCARSTSPQWRCSEISRERPIALLLDDLQWADQDSIRLLRYVVRANSSAPMFLMLTIRPEETAQVTEIVNLLADLERLGILRRMRVERLRQAETAAMLKSILGGEPTPAAAATIHAQAEGVPFIVQELTRTYREGGSAAADRRHLGTGTQRRSARPVGGPDADPTARRIAAGRNARDARDRRCAGACLPRR